MQAHKIKKIFSNTTANTSNNEDTDTTNFYHQVPPKADNEYTQKLRMNQRVSKIKPRTRYGLLNAFSKIHFKFGLTYDTLFLAFDLF